MELFGLKTRNLICQNPNKMGKRKIGLVELYGHSEVLFILYRLLKSDYDLSVFTTESIKQDAEDYFEEKKNKWKSQPSKISKEKFIQNHLKEINQQDILIFITLISSYRFFAKTTFKPKTILVVHNVNTMLLPIKKRWIDNSSISSYTFDILRLMREFFLRTYFYKKQLLQQMDLISFASPTLTNYAQSITNQYNQKIIEPLPFGFYEHQRRKSKSLNEVTISIPGVVTQVARDYEMLFAVFKKVIIATRKKIILQLLGNSNNKSGKRIVQELKKLEGEKFQLNYFSQPLAQKEYDTCLINTHFMILPIKKFRKFGLCREEYGVSNISGSVNDMLRFGIPAILVEHYKVEKPLHSLVHYFRNEDELEKMLVEWIETSKYTGISKEAIPILGNFSKEKSMKKWSEIFDRM